jgi:hypothetical protein
MKNKRIILDNLHLLIAENVIGDKQYSSRYKGFVGELAFIEWLGKKKTKRRTFNGGYFVPIDKGSTCLMNPVYFTVSRDQPVDYIPIYQSINKLDCSCMFFIHWDDQVSIDDWELEDVMGIDTPIPKPKFITYIFDSLTNSFLPSELSKVLDLYQDRRRKSRASKIPVEVKVEFVNKLSNFDFEHLEDLYVQRLIFDGFLGYGKNHGIPSDIDSIIEANNPSKLVFLEVKEKDLSKTEPIGFGMDVNRIKDLELLSLKSNIPCKYIVRQVNNQVERGFINWRYIDIHDFIKHLGANEIQGGFGMGFEEGKYPTKICPEYMFGILD